MRIHAGRFTAEIDEPFVVFLIGIRLNRLRALHKWVPVARSMPPMIRTLTEHPAKGMLGTHAWAGWRQAMFVQYWRSFEDLDRFARSPEEPHLSAWREFHRRVGDDGSVGIWHETYLVDRKAYECVYGNMPIFGLAAATRHVEAVGARETARLRLGRDEGGPPVAPPARSDGTR